MSTLKNSAAIRSRLIHQPQTLWLRRAMFQLHLWTGLAICIYVLVMSLSGSAIVFRREMDLALCPRIVMVKPSGPRLSEAQLAAAASQAGPRGFSRSGMRIEIRGPRLPGAAVEVRYFSGLGRFERLFDPYTGRDLGDATACEPAAVTRLAELHDDLLAGSTGRAINGAGAVLVTMLSVTGAVIWWPGLARWWRSMILHRHVHWRRFIWDLHSVFGFWSLALVQLWALSSIYFAFPSVFNAAVDFLASHGAGPALSQRMDVLTDWLSRLHFGRAFGPWVEVLWAILGLLPAGLAVTGVLMWWNRTLRPRIKPAG